LFGLDDMTQTATCLAYPVNSDIKPPLLVVDPERLYRPEEKTVRLWKIRNPNIEIRNKSEILMFKCLKRGKQTHKADNNK
jgi:hypothetical protein